MNQPKPDIKNPIFSTLSKDPEMVDLVELYVSEMPGRANHIEQSISSSSWAQLASEAHKLRGSAEGHGFAQIGSMAGQVEDLIRCSAGKEEKFLNQIREQAQSLADMCKRAMVRKA